MDFDIEIVDLSLEMYLGVHEWEQRKKQRAIIGAKLNVSQGATATDSFFDYDEIVQKIREFNDTKIATQEELVLSIALIALHLGANRAEISSRKPDVFSDAQSIGVALKLDRGEIGTATTYLELMRALK